MERLRATLKNNGVFTTLFSSFFFFSLMGFLTIYINSTYLSTYFSESFVGIIFMIGSALALVMLIIAPALLKKIGNYWLFMWILVIEIYAMLGLALFQHPWAAFFCFLILMTVTMSLIYQFDIFLETSSKNEETTGSVRGTFLTTSNIALLMAPLITGFILTDGDFWKVYLLAAILGIPFFWITAQGLKGFQDPRYSPFQTLSTFKCVFQNKNLTNIMVAQLLLRIFFSWIIIYVPIYLTSHIGFTWAEFGIILSIGLLPYVLLELPIGWLADKYIGEKEVLIMGFFVLSGTLVMMTMFPVLSVAFWASLIFLNRIGATMVEITTESYFFKHVDGNDGNTMGCFRMTRPFSYIIGPAIASAALVFLPFESIFVVLAGVMLIGVVVSLFIVDTK